MANQEGKNNPNFKHGLHNSSEYNCWKNIKKRCLNPECPAYKNYGGRGITICDEWKDSFINFYNDMGLRPSSDSTIERADNEKGYSKENCIWTSKKVQARNRRTNHIIIYEGKKTVLQYWADRFNVSHNNIVKHMETKTIEELIEYYESKTKNKI